MPESRESGGKATDLFVGVVDLFAIILPGALITCMVWKALSLEHEEPFRRLTPPALVPEWLSLLVASYILGHFVSAASSWIMDPLYDGYYKRQYEFNGELPSIRRRADRVFSDVIGKLYREGDNRLTWGESFLRIGSAAATADLDRLEANSKFFRSLTAVAILSVPILFSPLTSWTSVRHWCIALIIYIALFMIVFVGRKRLTPKTEITERVKLRLLDDKLGPQAAPVNLPSRLDWTDEEWLEAERKVCLEDARKFRWFALILPLVWLIFLVLLAFSVHRVAALPLAAFCWLLTIVSAKRFMDLRVKRLVHVYYFVIALNKMIGLNPSSPEKKT